MKKYLKDIEVSGIGRDAHVVSGEGEDDDDDADSSDTDDEDEDYTERNGKDLVIVSIYEFFFSIC